MFVVEEALHPVPACMHYSECHSQAAGSRQDAVGSHNPVNVEQHLIRLALRRDRLHYNVPTLCVTPSAQVNALCS